MSLVLCDTNILIEFYKGNAQVTQDLKQIGLENIGLSTVTAGELFYGAINKRELKQINKDLSNLTMLPVDREVSDLFYQLMREYSLSHKLAVPDVLIAATALQNKIPLFTLNKKDFYFIKNLILY